MENKVLNYYINNIKYNATKGYTLLQILVQHNIDIPRYCYHEKLTIAGNCRMCLIEEDKSLKPLASCAIVLGVNDLKLYTNTEKVKKAREAVIEFLLINHPLDCPICDQGGECDLQDQTSVFGSDRGRFYEYKRSVGDKNLGVFIKTSMNRCIHCTRCVRFAEELGGYSELGVVGRGSAMEISTYVSKFIDNELSGNLIDLCPVGALISKPFSYSARPWELSSFETVDIFDSFVSPIRVDTRGNKILRILPSLDKDLNENWISDKIRFIYDGLINQRLLNPFLRNGNNYICLSWNKIYYYLKVYLVKCLFKLSNLLCFNLFSIVGTITNAESCYLTKLLSNFLGYSNYFALPYNTGDILTQNIDFRSNYIVNKDLFVRNSSNNIIVFMLNINLRLESPLLSFKFKSLNDRLSNITFFNISNNYNSNFFIRNLSNNLNIIFKILNGEHWVCSNMINSAVYFVFADSIAINQSVSNNFLITSISYIRDNITFLDNIYINTLQKFASSVGILDFGIVGGNHSLKSSFNINNKIDTVNFYYLSDLQSCDFFKYLQINKYNNVGISNSFLIYQGSFAFNTELIKPDILLPSKSFIEKSSLFFNFVGKLRKTSSFSFSSSNYTRPDWQILTTLLKYLGLKNFSNKKLLFAYMSFINPFVNRKINFVNSKVFSDCLFSKVFLNKYNSLNLIFYNYFSSDIVSKNSFNLNFAAKNSDLQTCYNYR